MLRIRNKIGWITLIGLFFLSSKVFSQDPDFHIYLCFGQSNMAGAAKAEAQDTTVDKRFRMMSAMNCAEKGREKGNWYPATPPLSDCNAGISPADYFGRTLIKNLPQNIKVGVINVSVGGCKIELFDKENYQSYVDTAPEWMKGWIKSYGGNPYGRLVEMAKLAQKDGVIKGILLHQGESNPNDSLWTQKVKKVYDNLMTDLNLKPEQVPLLAGELVNFDQNGACAPFNAFIAKLPEVIPNAHVIPSAGCKGAPDRLHFTADGYRELGKRYGAKMLDILGEKGLSKSWKDINYAGDAQVFHNLDIYLPKLEKPHYPVVILIYGSAWLSNNSKGADLPTLGKALLDGGFAVVMPNHRSSNDAIFPAQVNDIKAVIRFVRANAAKYQLDTSFIGITGSSSGGSLAAMAGTTGAVKKFTLGKQTVDIEGKVGQYTTLSSSVDAVVDWFGPTNMLVMDSCGGTAFIHNDIKSPASLYIGGAIQENKAKTLLASPITYVDKNDPPFLIFHGDNDKVVPFCQSEFLFVALQKAHVSSRFYLVPNGQHGPGVHTEPYLEMMVDFFRNKSENKRK